MMMRCMAAILALGATTLSAGSVRAEEWTRQSFLLPEGGFEITGDPARPLIAGTSLSDGSVGEPFFVAPHLYWGATDDLALGVSHRLGLCFNGCGDKVYNDAGFDMLLYLTGSERFELDLHVGAPVRSFDPFFVGLQGGVLGRANLSEVVALVFDPSIYVAFSKRDEGNGDELDLPFWFYFQATPVLVPFVGSAFTGPLDGFFEKFAVPLEGGLLIAASANVHLGFVLRFENLLGHGGSSDWRSLGFLAQFRF
jgi:hypothetical protein